MNNWKYFDYFLIPFNSIQENLYIYFDTSMYVVGTITISYIKKIHKLSLGRYTKNNFSFLGVGTIQER